MSLNYIQVEEFKNRLAEKFTASELVELLELTVEDIIEEWWEYLLEYKPEILDEIGVEEDE